MYSSKLLVATHKGQLSLHQLGDLHFIKVIKGTGQPKQKLSEKYGGKLPPDVADELQAYLTQSRNEWS